MIDAVLGVLILFGMPFVTGNLYMLLRLADGEDYMPDSETLTAVSFFWPLTFPWLLFVETPCAVWFLLKRNAQVAQEVIRNDCGK